MIQQRQALTQAERLSLSHFLLREQSTREILKKDLGLSLGMISSVVKKFHEREFIYCTDRSSPKGTGRRQEHLARNKDYGYALIIDLTVGYSQIAMVNLSYQVEYQIFVEKHTNDTDYIQRLLAECIQMEKFAHLIRFIVLSVPEDLKLRNKKYAEISHCSDSHSAEHANIGKKLIEYLQKNIEKPVYTINNVRSLALYDSHFYVDNIHFAERKSLVYIYLGEGVASVLLEPFSPSVLQPISSGEKAGRGGRYRYQRLGHICITDRQIPCWCGRYGCLEGLCSEWAWRKFLGKFFQEKGRKDGDGALDCLSEWQNQIYVYTELQDFAKASCQALLRALEIIENLLEPEIICISGDFVRYFPYFTDMLQKSYTTAYPEKQLLLQPVQRQNHLKGAALWGFYQYGVQVLGSPK